MTSNAETKQNVYNGAITKSDLLHMATNIGALGCEYSWNYPRQMHISFALMVNPLLKKIYKNDPEGYKAALSRHMEFFNITPQLQPFAGGIVVSMEERVAKDELDPAAISSVKAALMGPLSGIGDSVFLACIRVIAVAVGVSLMTMGNPLGPIAYILTYNIPAFLLRLFGATKGYEIGFSFLEQAEASGLMNKVIYAAGIVGIMVIGAMTVSLVSVTIPVQIGASVTGESVQTVQDILNSILPGLLPLCALGIYYWLLKKNVSPMIMIFATMILGVVGVYLGFLA